MRILILGARGQYRTEASLARAARSLGHTATVVDALGWRRRLGPWSGRAIRWQLDRFRADFILCTRHAVAVGDAILGPLLSRVPSALWYFDAAPLPAPVVTLARRVARVFATYGYQVEAFRQGGAADARFLPQGMDPELDRPIGGAPASERCDVSFVGSGQYPRRHPLLAELAPRVRLQIRGPGWAGVELPVAGGPVRGPAFARVIGAAAISLGIDALPEQRRERHGGSSNRLWRVLGAGGFFLGEHVEGIEVLARHGAHAAWYRSHDEAIDLTRHYLTAAAERQRIAMTGRAHALQHHTYAHRLARLLAGEGHPIT